jgi:uncharacterized protein YjbI with pentapeptide repeats
MKVIKPMTLGALTRSYQFGGERRFAVSALGFFPLGVAVQRFATENEQWPAVVNALASLGIPQPLDEVFAKPRAELLVTGSAYAPQQQPVRRMQVTLAAAGVTKTLTVSGDREWRYDPWLRIGEPQPFVTMPLGYARAFGGARHAGNPLGNGYDRNRLAALIGANRGAMPNLELPDEPVRRHWIRYAPANFGPLGFDWQPRIAHAGRYGRKWRSREMPGFPSNASRDLFLRAPADQQLAGYLHGGEPYCLSGMHPLQASIEGQVPALRARAFIQRRDGAGIEEVSLAFDTLWFFPELMLGVAQYHGETVHHDPLSFDIEAVMVAYEAQSAPRPLAHYEQVFAHRTDPALAAAHMFNESELAADYDAPAVAARKEAAAARQRAADDTRAERRAAWIADFFDTTGVDPATLAQQPPPRAPLPVPDRASIAESDFDLTDMLAGVDTLVAEVRAQAERLRATLPELPSVPAPAEDTHARREAALVRAAVAADDLAPQAAAAAQRATAADAAARGANADAAAVLAEQPARMRAARRARMRYTDPDGALPPLAARWLGVQVEQWLRAGVLLAGRDLAGIDLSGFDLSRADLREVQLENADLRNTRFTGAQLDRAVLTGARLDGADFSGASLVDANLSHSSGRGVGFAGANLTRAWAFHANWPEANLSDARLDDCVAPEIELAGAHLERVAAARSLLLNARAPGSHWRGAQLTSTVLLRAQLSGADFGAATLRKVVLMDAVLANGRFADATLADVAAGGKLADWSHVVATGLRAQHCSWHQATLVASDWRGASAAQCDFGRADFSHAVLDDASFAGCLLTAATLAGVHAQRADLFRAVCRSADFSDAMLRDASLYQADTSDALFARADLRGIVLEAGRRAVA